MDITTRIQAFHDKINYQLKREPLQVLIKHQIKTLSSNLVGNKQVKVRAFHFGLLSAKRSHTVSAMNQDRRVTWEEFNNFEFYFEKELKEFAMRCLYLTSIPLGECVVQRLGKKELVVNQLRALDPEELTENEKEKLILLLSQQYQPNSLTFGCDIEVMLYNPASKKYINGDVLVNHHSIGLDDAIAVYDRQVYYPIIEIRPKPAFTMKQLHNELMILHQRLEKKAANHQLHVITEANPFGRFFLGGHIHFGNTILSFQHVRLLDLLVAIPFAIVEKNHSYARRIYYGSLGSIRENHFCGFEYRVLPSWFRIIPECLPLLQWIEYIMRNYDQLSAIHFQDDALRSYYQPDVYDRSLDEWVLQTKSYFLDSQARTILDEYVICLKKLI